MAALQAKALIRACGAQRRLSQRQVPFQLQHNIVSREDQQDAQRLGRQHTTFRHHMLQQRRPGELGKARWFWPILPFTDWHEAIRVPCPKTSPHLFETHRHKGHSCTLQSARTAAAGKPAICLGAWSRLVSLLSMPSGMILLCPVCPLCQCYDAPSRELSWLPSP